MEIPLGSPKSIVNPRLKSGDLRGMPPDDIGQRRDVVGAHAQRRLACGKSLEDLPDSIDRLEHLRGCLDDPRSLVRGARDQVTLLQAVQSFAQRTAADTVALSQRGLADLR